MGWYLSCWKKCATFAGRARRKEYWTFVFWTVIFGIVVGFLDAFVEGGGMLLKLFLLASLLPWWAVSVRRLHDTDHCGWRILNFFGVFEVFFILMALEGTNGANRYGDNPKGA